MSHGLKMFNLFLAQLNVGEVTVYVLLLLSQIHFLLIVMKTEHGQ